MQEFLTHHTTSPYYDVGQQLFTKERRVSCPNIIEGDKKNV